MQVTGTHFFAASADEVWNAIHDPATLKACIPQCDQIEPARPDYWLGKAHVNIGPFTVPFTGEITLSDITPPDRYVIAIKAKGWVGQAHGLACVRLHPETGGTRLNYDAEVHIGIRLLDKAMNMAHGVARDLADSFFGRLDGQIRQRQAEPVSSCVCEPRAAGQP